MNTTQPIHIAAFLAGAGKCGTTTLSDLLFQHPQITPLREDPVAQAHLLRLRMDEKVEYFFPKEPHVMLSRTTAEGARIDWDKNMYIPGPKRAQQKSALCPKKAFDGWLASCLPTTPQKRPHHWNTLAVDCSPGYFLVPGCAQAIKSLYPDACIIITLRHPTDWLHSHYYVRLQRSRVEPQFAKHFSFEKDLRGPTMWRIKRFPSRWVSSTLSRWLDVFEKDQIKIIILEEWCKRLKQTAQECYRFIGVDDSFAPKLRHCNPNPSDAMRYPISRIARTTNKLVWRYAKHNRRLLEKWALYASRFRLFSQRPPMPDHLRRQLDDHFKPQVKAVENMLGRDIPVWHRDS